MVAGSISAVLYPGVEFPGFFLAGEKIQINDCISNRLVVWLRPFRTHVLHRISHLTHVLDLFFYNLCWARISMQTIKSIELWTLHTSGLVWRFTLLATFTFVFEAALVFFSNFLMSAHINSAEFYNRYWIQLNVLSF